MQKLVKGATKPKATAPKAKYIEPILATTYEAGRDFDAVMDGLGRVIGSRGGAWPSIYKGLIVVHIMIREGAEDVTLDYVGRHSRLLEIEDHAHRAPAMGRYARYLTTRGQQFRETKIDYVRYKTRQGFSRLHSLSIQKGLMRECTSVLVQLDALMKCQYQEQDIVNDDVLLMAFRLLVHDALSLFQVLNEGVINLLEHFFELSKPDAEQALDIYRGFRRLTAKVIAYLHTAKDLEFKTLLHVPNIKHAPTSLVSSLEMYLNDPDFESNRRQYLAEKEAHDVKRTKSSGSRAVSSSSARPTQKAAQLQPQQQPQSQPQQPQQPPPQQNIAAVQQQAVAAQQQAALQPQLTQSAQQQQQHQQQFALQQQATAQPLQQQPTYQLQQALAPGSIQMVSPDVNGGNPFWQSQQEAMSIQTADGQAQAQMQQLRQLQMQQIEQQQRIRQQIEQLQQQQQQVQQVPPQPVQQTPFLDPSHTGFDFGLQPTGAQTQQVPQAQFQPAQAMPQQQQQPLVAQHTDYNPFKHGSVVPSALTTPASVDSIHTVQTTHTGTNPFKSPQPAAQPQRAQFTGQFAQFDFIGQQLGSQTGGPLGQFNQMNSSPGTNAPQQNLIDFGHPQTQQATGTNPFRV